VLKRLGATALPRSVLITGKTSAVLILEAVQIVLICGLGFILGWQPQGDPLWPVLLIVIGTAAFGGLGLLVAGTLRAEVTLAAAEPHLAHPAVLRRDRHPVGQVPARTRKRPAAPPLGRAVRRVAPCATARIGTAGPRLGDASGVDRVCRPGRCEMVPMGVTARVRAWFASPRVLTGLAIASIVANCAIVVTGGAVRLTSSGLGCPTWPSCTDSSLTPTRQAAAHGLIEFTNRQLTFVLGAIALATLIAAVVQRRQVALAALAPRDHSGTGRHRRDQLCSPISIRGSSLSTS
jgi:hypothetical protein